jgi:hypothetical protein
VIQCLLPSAVTSLGSPAKLSIRAWHRGALSPGPASKKSGATGSPRRAFSLVGPLALVFGRAVFAGLARAAQSGPSPASISRIF